MDLTVKTISQDGLDMISYDNNFYIEDGILYYGDEELARDVEDDLLYAAEKIVEYCHDTVLEITDDNGDIIYENGSEPYSDDKELRYNDYFGESFKSLNEKLQKYVETVKDTLTDEDLKMADIVTVDNLEDCYHNINKNLYTRFSPNGPIEIVDGFSEDEVREAIENGNTVWCY